MEWNGFEGHQTPLINVFVDLTAQTFQEHSYRFDLSAQ